LTNDSRALVCFARVPVSSRGELVARVGGQRHADACTDEWDTDASLIRDECGDELDGCTDERDERTLHA
jgi:hypothetical protein